MRLGIFAPYDRGETTMMALRLAFSAMRAGWSVRWLAPTQSRHLPVHPYWDRLVIPSRPGRVPDWARRTTRRVWFTMNRDAFTTARKARRRMSSGLPSRDILVLPWHATTPADVDMITAYDSVVCANRLVFDGYGQSLALTGDGAVTGCPPATICQWPSGFKPDLRLGWRGQSGPRAVLHADRYTCRRHGRGVVDVAAQLLAAVPNLRLCVAPDLTPDRCEHRKLQDMLGNDNGRLKVALRLPVDRLLAEVYDADWLIDVSVRHGCGLLPAQAQAMGVPSVAWGVNPVADGVIGRNPLQGCAGVAVACDYATTACGAETAEWDTDAVAETCATALSDVHLLCKAQTYAFGRAKYADNEGFSRFWQDALEVQHVA